MSRRERKSESSDYSESDDTESGYETDEGESESDEGDDDELTATALEWLKATQDAKQSVQSSLFSGGLRPPVAVRHKQNSIIFSQALDMGVRKYSESLKSRESKDEPPGMGSKELSEDGQQVVKIFNLFSSFNSGLQQFFKNEKFLTDHFPQTVLDSINDVGNKVLDLTHYLQTDLNSLGLGDKTDPEALIEQDRMDWDFDNPVVEEFKKVMLQQDYSTSEYKDWHIPRYLDYRPIPPSSETAMAEIIFQPEWAVEKMKVNLATPCIEVIRNAIKHFEVTGEVSNYVLKAFGYREYFYGDGPLLNSQYVRTRARSGKDITLVLTEKPEPKSSTLKMPPVQRTLASIEEKEVIQMYELDRPFSIHIGGIDHCTPVTLPLLDEEITKLYIMVFLFHGRTQIPGTTRVSRPVGRSYYPQWNRMIKGRNTRSEPKIKDLPRETRIAFLLNGTKTNGTQSYVLGYAVRQFVDENGYLLTGCQNLNLWGITKEQEEKNQQQRNEPNHSYRRTK